MFKKISILLSITLLLCSINASTSSASGSSNITYLENGYYIITEDIQEINNFTGIDLLATTTTKSVSKSSKMYDTSDRLIATLTVYASFSIDTGVSVTCTKVEYTKTISNNNWTFVSGTTSKNNTSSTKASATAKGTFKNTLTGKTVPITVTVSCTNRGDIS